MITFLITLDVILSILIILSVFLYRGNDGFMGETTQTIATDIKFETYDKVVGSFIVAFFLVTLLINYLVIKEYKGVDDVNSIINQITHKKDISPEKKTSQTESQDNHKQNDSSKGIEAPLGN